MLPPDDPAAVVAVEFDFVVFDVVFVLGVVAKELLEADEEEKLEGGRRMTPGSPATT